ncbi:hypothetical protein TELCIR_19341, partial [Teladorsagia circumcincta]
FSYNNEEVRIRWNKRGRPVFVLKPINISDFWLKNITPAVIRRLACICARTAGDHASYYDRSERPPLDDLPLWIHNAKSAPGLLYKSYRSYIGLDMA